VKAAFPFPLKTNNGYPGAPEGTQSGDGPPSPDDDNNLYYGGFPLPPLPCLVNIQTTLRPLLHQARSPSYMHYVVFAVTEQAYKHQQLVFLIAVINRSPKCSVLC
jgi:hypothetical protein